MIKTRPTIYPFNLNAGGHGAPRFQDGKLVAKRQWRNLNNCEKTPYQVSLGVQLLEGKFDHCNDHFIGKNIERS